MNGVGVLHTERCTFCRWVTIYEVSRWNLINPRGLALWASIQQEMNRAIAFIGETIVVLIKTVQICLVSLATCFISKPRKSIKNEVVLLIDLSGASALCAELLPRLLQCGASVAMWTTDKDCKSKDSLKVHCMHCDFKAKEDIQEAIRETEQTVGQITMVVIVNDTNKDEPSHRDFLNYREEDLESFLKVNILSHFIILHHFLPKFIHANHGHIVSIVTELKNQSAANASSMNAVIGLAETVANEIEFSSAINVYTSFVVVSLDTLPTPSVIDRIINGILTNQKQIYIPVSRSWHCIIKALLPESFLSKLPSMVDYS